MSELISGKEALIALANGEEVEYIGDMKTWFSLNKEISSWNVSEVLGSSDAEDDTTYQFRLKPRTITIKGIEVPCCGKDYQYGDAMYILNSLEPEEFSLVVLDKADEVPAYWWSTEAEIKQVVAALRSIFNPR